MNDQVKYLTADELVERWNRAVTVGTLANWRGQKKRKGPAFVKFGANVRYPLHEVVKWEQANMINDNLKGEGGGQQEQQ